MSLVKSIDDLNLRKYWETSITSGQYIMSQVIIPVNGINKYESRFKKIRSKYLGSNLWKDLNRVIRENGFHRDDYLSLLFFETKRVQHFDGVSGVRGYGGRPVFDNSIKAADWDEYEIDIFNRNLKGVCGSPEHILDDLIKKYHA